MRSIEMMGREFGRLTVVAKGETVPGDTFWLCECSCGGEKLVRGQKLREGLTRSCGCLRSEVARRPKGLRVPAGWSTFVQAAKGRGRNIGISMEEFAEIDGQPCRYCGTPVVQTRTSYCIDRIDNSVGYEPGNIAACCGLCNSMKMATNEDTFLAQVERIARWITRS